MSIRPLEPGDRAQWQPLWEGYLTFYGEHLAPGVTEATFDRLAGYADGMAGFVACDAGGRVIGFVHVVVHPSTWTTDRYVSLEDLFVAPEARGSGTGRALIEYVYAWAGDRRVYWQTQATNRTARTLYDRVARDSGFIVYERP